MFLRTSKGVCLQPKPFSSIKNTRNLRPSIQIGKDKFKLCVDVHHFNKDEIRVKVHPEHVIIEGKQEKDTQQGYISKQFVRKFNLPDGYVPAKMKCTLCPEGMLIVEAQRSLKDLRTPVETVLVPISHGQSQRENKNELITPPPTEPKVFTCKNYPKVKPQD